MMRTLVLMNTGSILKVSRHLGGTVSVWPVALIGGYGTHVGHEHGVILMGWPSVYCNCI